MQPAPLSISELFQQREQYLIPLFQRGYVWTLTDQIQPLWEDIVDRVDALQTHRENAQRVIGGIETLKPLRKHFLGAIVIGSPVSVDTQIIATREVIDGQQRITTLQIMLLALRDLLKLEDDEALSEDVGLLTFNKGRYRQKSDHLKVWPTNAGRDEIQALMEAGSFEEACKRFPVKGASREKIERPLMVQAYLFFFAMLACMVRGKRFDDPMPGEESDEHTIARAVIRSIDKDNSVEIPFSSLATSLDPLRLLLSAFENAFQIMRLQLGPEDDPQIIFETLNARGAPLQPSDLVRNFLFLRATRNGEDVDALYEKHWRDFDERPEPGGNAKGAKFWKKEERQGRLKTSRLDLLLYHY
ncbi:MAG: DUF262 domain-containing protein, partial [Bradyrhizobium sp.]